MNTLFIDTSQKIMTVAVVGQATHIKRIEGEKNHSALLLPTIDAVLTDANTSIGDIDIFALVVGTGSFTGLRVGLATLKGLLFGKRSKILSVNSEELTAYYTACDQNLKNEILVEFIHKKTAKAKETNGFLTLDKVELHYENPETKRFKY